MYKNMVFPMLMLVLLCTLPSDAFSQVDKLKKKVNDAKKEVKDVKKDLPDNNKSEEPASSERGGSAPAKSEPTNSAGRSSEKSNSTNNSTSGGTEPFGRYLTNQSALVARFYSPDPEGAQHCDFGRSTGGAIYSELDRAKTFDRAAFDQRVAAAKTSGEFAANEARVQKIQAMLDGYDAFIGNSSKAFADFFDDINNVANDSPADNTEELDETAAFVNVLLHFSPNSQKALNWMKAVEKEKAKYGGSMDAAASSDFHKQHMNQVVFSKKPYAIGQEVSGEIVKDFASGDYIYATLYLDNPIIKRLGNDATSIGLNLSADGNIITFDDRTRAWIKKDALEKTYVQFALTPDEAWMAANGERYIEKGSPTFANINREIGELGPFEHEISLLITFPGVNEKITCKFNLDLTEGPEFYAKLGKNFQATALGVVGLPKAGMSNPSLEKEALQICRDKYGDGNTYHKAIITSTAWDVERNELTGVIIGRSMQFAIVFSTRDGVCRFQYFTFAQDYVGGGYSNMLKYASVGDLQDISCDKVK